MVFDYKQTAAGEKFDFSLMLLDLAEIRTISTALNDHKDRLKLAIIEIDRIPNKDKSHYSAVRSLREEFSRIDLIISKIRV